MRNRVLLFAALTLVIVVVLFAPGLAAQAPSAARRSEELDPAPHAVGRSGCSGILAHCHVYALTTSGRARWKSVLHRRGGLRSFQEGRRDRRFGQSEYRPLRLERVCDGWLAKSGQAKPPHVVDRGSGGWAPSAINPGRTETAGRRQSRSTGSKSPGRR